jgi:PKD repeat protein
MQAPSKKIIISILANIALCFNAIAISDALKIKIIKGSTSDETVVRFLPTATFGFDGSYDAYKMFSTSPVVPSIFTNIDSDSHLSINALPSFSSLVNVDLFTLIKVSGTYTIQSIELGTGFTPDIKLVLEDKETGIFYNFRNGAAISIDLTVNTMATANRFSIHVSPPMNVVTTNVTCNGLNNGIIQLSKPGNHSWSYILSDNNSSDVMSGTDIDESVLITNLNPGTYTLYSMSNFSLQDTSFISITEPEAIIADFTANYEDVYLSDAQITFTNNSINATSFNWNFGDGNFSTDSATVTHQFLTEGTFDVTLTSSNSNGCSSSFTKTITVNANLSTGLSESENTPHFTSFQSDGILHINMSAPTVTNISINIYNEMGQSVYSYASNESSLADEISFESKGIYIVNSIIGNKVQSQKIIYLSNK